MSDLGPILDALGDEPVEGAVAYSRGAWMWGQAAAGESFNSTYAGMQGTPLGIRRADALSMWQGIQSTQAEAMGAAGIGFDQLASGALRGEPPANWTGQYAYRVDVTTRTRDNDGSYFLETVPKWFISGSVLNPEQAVGVVQNMLELPAGVGSPDAISSDDVVMTNLSGAWYRTMPGVLG